MVDYVNSPKEMLGYLITNYIQQMMPLVSRVPFEKKLAISLQYMVEALDRQMVSFRDEMSLTKYRKLKSDPNRSEEVVLDYKVAIKHIRGKISKHRGEIYQKNYDPYMDALFDWMELLASAYSKLGLVPESGENLEEPEQIMEEEPLEEQEEEVIPTKVIPKEPEPKKEPQNKNLEPEEDEFQDFSSSSSIEEFSD